MKSLYGEHCQLLNIDSDSLLLEIQTEDVYQDMAKHADPIDTSDYPKDHLLHGMENKKVLGKMKDECAGRRIAEYVGLRPKMYSILEASGKSIKKAKGVKKNTVTKHIRHEQYKEALFEKQTFRHGIDAHALRLQALDRRKWGGHTGLWAQRCNPCKLSSSTLSPRQDPIRRQLCVRGLMKKFLADESPLRPILQVVQHRLARLGHRAPKPVNR